MVKVIVFLVVMLLESCAYKQPEPRARSHHHDVEIFCPDIGRKILIETVDRREVVKAIRKFIEQKRTQGTNENYTVLRFEDKSSLIIKKIPPEKLITCSIVNVRPTIVKRYYKF